MITGTSLYDEIDKVIDTFQWGYGDAVYGEVRLDRESNTLRLQVFCMDTEDPDGDEAGLLIASREVTDYESPQEQIRNLIHWHLAHESDEQMWFNGERTFYPHNEDGSTRW